MKKGKQITHLPPRRAFPAVLSVLIPVLGIMILACWPKLVRGQGFFADPVPIEEAFGIPHPPSESIRTLPNLVDIDGDGDLDIFLHERGGVDPRIAFYENQGSAECPEFVHQPGQLFGLPSSIVTTHFVDMDDDGDLDVFGCDNSFQTVIYYYENKGSATAPQFNSTAGETIFSNDWAITAVQLTFGDLDGDGDYDAFVTGIGIAAFRYLENVGGAGAFNFAPLQYNPYGLWIPGAQSSERAKLIDWDCDGDLDVVNSHLDENHNWVAYYHENVGSPTAPEFLAGVPTGDILTVFSTGDLDGDGDQDLMNDEYYYQNIAQHPGCVTQPQAAFSFQLQPGLGMLFTNESTAQATECRPITWSWDFGDQLGSAEQSPMHVFPEAGTYNVCLTVEDVAGIQTYCEEIEVVLSAARDQKLEAQLRVFPNPASDVLFVEWENKDGFELGSVSVFNARGERLVEKMVNFNTSSPLRMDLRGIPAGYYLLKVRSGGRFITKAFVKMD